MTDIPVYVTRKTATGLVGSISLNAYLMQALWLLLLANAFGWGTFSLYALADKIV